MFYKNENGVLVSGTVVIGSNIHLVSELKDSYVYPCDGWYWFDVEDDARAFFNIPTESTEPNLNVRISAEDKLAQALTEAGKHHLVERARTRMVLTRSANPIKPVKPTPPGKN